MHNNAAATVPYLGYKISNVVEDIGASADSISNMGFLFLPF